MRRNIIQAQTTVFGIEYGDDYVVIEELHGEEASFDLPLPDDLRPDFPAEPPGLDAFDFPEPAQEALADRFDFSDGDEGDEEVADDLASAKGGTKGKPTKDDGTTDDGSTSGPGNGKGNGKDKDDGTTDDGGTTDDTDTGGTTDTGSTDPTTDPNVHVSGQDTPDGFNIRVEFLGDAWTDALREDFVSAAEAISDFITGDLPDVVYNGVSYDDITISATLAEIDGSGGTLGMAGPSYLRGDSYLPFAGVMYFDSADAETLDGRGQFDEVVMHEMMHTLGFGTVWDYLGLLSETADGLLFNGPLATAEYEASFNGGVDALGVPVEEDGGSGTARSHWDEARFDSELMTGWLDSSTYLSDMTIAALEDMGYETTFGDLIA